MLLATALFIYMCVAAALYVVDISRPYSQSFSYRQHRDNCLVGALLWPIGAVLLLIVKFMPSDLRRSTALIL